MGSYKPITALANGLRALELLARLAPIDLAGYARAGQFNFDMARTLIETFEAGGYITRLPLSELLVLDADVLELVFTSNPVGTLVTRAATSLRSLAEAIGVPVDLSIRRGAETLRVLASDDDPRLPVGAITPLLSSVSGEIFSAFNDDRTFGHTDRLLRQGYGVATNDADNGTIAIPLLAHRRPIAVLAAHFSVTDCVDPVAVFLPALLDAGRKMLPPPEHRLSPYHTSEMLAPVSVH